MLKVCIVLHRNSASELCGVTQARREPQRGPGNHHRGPLTTSFRMRRDLREGRKRRDGCLLTIRLGVWGSIVSSPSGVRGGAATENGFYAYLRSERQHLKHSFLYF